VDDTNKRSPGEKKPYAPPEIQEVPLRPDEAVLGGCKTNSKSGSTQVNCSVPHTCSSLTS